MGMRNAYHPKNALELEVFLQKKFVQIVECLRKLNHRCMHLLICLANALGVSFNSLEKPGLWSSSRGRPGREGDAFSSDRTRLTLGITANSWMSTRLAFARCDTCLFLHVCAVFFRATSRELVSFLILHNLTLARCNRNKSTCWRLFSFFFHCKLLMLSVRISTQCSPTFAALSLHQSWFAYYQFHPLMYVAVRKTALRSSWTNSEVVAASLKELSEGSYQSPIVGKLALSRTFCSPCVTKLNDKRVCKRCTNTSTTKLQTALMGGWENLRWHRFRAVWKLLAPRSSWAITPTSTTIS